MTSQQIPMDLNPSTSCAEDSPAKTYPWLDSVRAWLEGGVPCSLSSPGSSLLLDLGGVLSRTSRDSSVLTMDEISRSSSIDWKPGGMVWRGACLTLDTSECPSNAVGSTLLDILEGHAPQKYSLSRRASDFLLRAQRPGRTLPARLETALRAISSTDPPIGQTGASGMSSSGPGPSHKKPEPPGAVQAASLSVRRLTPTECERLQGFPDGWTMRATTDEGTLPSETP